MRDWGGGDGGSLGRGEVVVVEGPWGGVRWWWEHKICEEG